jgi:DNA-binding LytR/AlgR family response regulator
MKKEFKVLILEDDPFFEISLKYMFLDSVYEIVKVINCQTLLDESINFNKINLVISNVFIKGNYLTKELFLDLKRKGIPVVFISSVIEDNKYEELKDSVQGYLVKPFHKNTLLSVLKNCLEQSRKSKLHDFIDKKYLFVRNKGRELEKINFSEIVYLESAGNYCFINTLTKKYAEKISLTKMLKDKLDARFRRVHHKFAINAEYLERVGRAEVKLTNLTLPMSNTFKQNLNDITKNNEV